MLTVAWIRTAVRWYRQAMGAETISTSSTLQDWQSSSKILVDRRKIIGGASSSRASRTAAPFQGGGRPAGNAGLTEG